MGDRRKNYRPWDAQHNSQQSVSPQEALPEDDLVFFLIDLIPQLDPAVRPSPVVMSGSLSVLCF